MQVQVMCSSTFSLTNVYLSELFHWNKTFLLVKLFYP
uniref:Uncharacterized protein n=1 Tax=Anguilla anguilla TaxID=7936 RepID=A0A0E9R112_ANGAN